MCLDYDRKCISTLIMITSVYSDRILQLKTPFKFFVIFNSQPRFGYFKRNAPSFTSDKEKNSHCSFFENFQVFTLKDL